MFGVACLSALTGIVFKFTRILFLFEAAGVRPTYYIFTLQDVTILDDLSSIDLISNTGMCLVWTSIYSVKFFFLALFRLLIKRVSKRITIYFWIVVAVSTLFWVIQISFSTIPCHNLGLIEECKVIFLMLFSC